MGMTTDIHRQAWVPDAWRLRYWFGLLLVLPLLGVVAFAVFQPIQVLPRVALAPGFSLTDQFDNRLTSEDLRGSFVLYTFTYTNCDDDCPDTGPGMKRLQEELSTLDTDDIPLQYVTIFFDPVRDSQEARQAYAAGLGADTGKWHFVTGDADKLKNIIGGGFSTFYEERDDGSFEYYPAFALVDGWGILRAKYRSAAPEPSVVERDISLLLSEIRNSEGASRFAYEAAHLFLCYPDY